jgi:hypothetical protein
MSDGKFETIINLLVSCPRGTILLKSVDASNQGKDEKILFELLNNMVMEAAVENGVEIITNNASNSVLVGNMLEELHPTIFWTPCVVHCLDLMLKDISKIEWVKSVADQAKTITKFIYNHKRVLNIMRKKNTRAKELVPPRLLFATTFLLLQSLID